MESHQNTCCVRYNIESRNRQQRKKETANAGRVEVDEDRSEKNSSQNEMNVEHKIAIGFGMARTHYNSITNINSPNVLGILTFTIHLRTATPNPTHWRYTLILAGCRVNSNVRMLPFGNTHTQSCAGIWYNLFCIFYYSVAYFHIHYILPTTNSPTSTYRKRKKNRTKKKWQKMAPKMILFGKSIWSLKLTLMFSLGSKLEKWFSSLQNPVVFRPPCRCFSANQPQISRLENWFKTRETMVFLFII